MTDLRISLKQQEHKKILSQMYEIGFFNVQTTKVLKFFNELLSCYVTFFFKYIDDKPYDKSDHCW
ncbi:hypothetical protein GCM10007366_15000 [Mammaliicoccus vitulinus]|nr:hypothetical protein GCM10007366_15000 [Mammaliicoccus vitulinus]